MKTLIISIVALCGFTSFISCTVNKVLVVRVTEHIECDCEPIYKPSYTPLDALDQRLLDAESAFDIKWY